MHHHHNTRAIAEAHAADLQRTAARNRPTAPVRPRHRRRAIIAALVATCALAPAAAARAEPAHDIGTATIKHATAVADDNELAEPPWARALRIRSEGMNRLYGLGDAAGSPQPADCLTSKMQSYAEQVSKLSFEELAAAYNFGVPTAKVADMPGPITFTNPLGRSRGPGAGAGLL